MGKDTKVRKGLACCRGYKESGVAGAKNGETAGVTET